MDMIARAPGEPFSHFLALVGSIVVHNEMYVQVSRYVGINVLEELEKLLLTVSGLALSQH